jgi:hypothetical protein
MTNTIFLRCPTLLAILLLAFGLVTPLRAQSASTTTLLEDAYATLGQARHDYKGHRVRAMKQIEAAFNESGWKIRGTGRVHEPQGTSDAQLRDAQSLLQQAGAGLSGRALKHANDAIAQINDALAIK